MTMNHSIFNPCKLFDRLLASVLLPIFLVLLAFLGFASTSQAAAPVFQAAGANVSAGANTAISPVWPAGHAIGDIALLFVESKGDQPAVLSTSATFAPVLNSPMSASNKTRISVFWARATSAAMPTPTVTGVADHLTGQIITYRGVVSSGDPWDVTGGSANSSSNTLLTLGSITTTLADTLIVQTAVRDTDSAAEAFSAQTNGNLTSITERADTGTALNKGGGYAVWDGVKASLWCYRNHHSDGVQ